MINLIKIRPNLAINPVHVIGVAYSNGSFTIHLVRPILMTSTGHSLDIEIDDTNPAIVELLGALGLHIKDFRKNMTKEEALERLRSGAYVMSRDACWQIALNWSVYTTEAHTKPDSYENFEAFWAAEGATVVWP